MEQALSHGKQFLLQLATTSRFLTVLLIYHRAISPFKLIGGSGELEKIVIDNGIPLELCPSSNVIGQTVGGYTDHHFKEWGPLSRDHPIAICTDDMGVFKTSLSREYSLIAHHFSLNRTLVFRMARSCVNFVFAEDELKAVLRRKFESFCP